MDDFHHHHHRFSSSPSIKPSAITKDVDVDENEQNYQQTLANLENSKKNVTKNYMSTTISAASKALGPKRKILAEMNGAPESELSSFEANFQKISILDNSDESLSQQCNVDEEEGGLVADLSTQPYDPLTNYLSPRPQFLRYKPNRQRGRVIFCCHDSHEEADSDTNGSSVISSSSSSISGEKSQVQEEIEGTNSETAENEEEEIEDEEEEEDKEGCNLKGVLKSLLLLVVLVLSTMFISSMNSSTPLCSSKFYEDMEHGYFMMQNHTLGSIGVSKRVFEMGVVKENVVESTLVKKHESSVHSMYQGEAAAMHLKEEEGISINEDIEEESFEEIELANEAKVEDFGQVVEPQIEDNEDASSQGLLEPVEDYQAPFFSEEQTGMVVNPVEEVSHEDLIRSIPEEEGNSEDALDEVVMSESMVTDTKVNNENLKPVETESLFQVLGGVLIFLTIMASLLLKFRLRTKPRSEPNVVEEEKSIKKDSTPLPSKPYCEAWIEEKCIGVLPNRGDDHIDEVYSSGKNCQSSIPSNDKALEEEEFSRTRAPTVEFLGEFVVREIRSSGAKNRAIEVEESNYSVSSEKKMLGDKSHSVSIQAQPAHSEFSVMDSPSQGSYSAKKEDEANVVGMTPTPGKRSSRKREVKVVTTTPVRRSSRIRSQTILSP